MEPRAKVAVEKVVQLAQLGCPRRLLFLYVKSRIMDIMERDISNPTSASVANLLRNIHHQSVVCRLDTRRQMAL